MVGLMAGTPAVARLEAQNRLQPIIRDPITPGPVERTITLDVSFELGDLGPDWRKALSFDHYGTRFQLRWRSNLPLVSAVYRVLDHHGVELTTVPLNGAGYTEGYFFLRLADLPVRSGYVVLVYAANPTGPTGAPSNEITLTFQEPQPVPFLFADFTMQDIRNRFGVPGLTAAVSCSPGHALEWTAGVRRHGSSVPAQRGDRWHIGSDTKAMTTTMIAKLVDEGLLDWSTSIWELAYGPRNLFPEISTLWAPFFPWDLLHARFQHVTIEHLASHRSGIRMLSSEDAPTRQFMNYFKDPTDFRWETARSLLTRNHAGIIGEWRYGHGNYILLAVIIERLRGKPYEQVIKDELFAALGMTTADFGMPTDVVLPPPPPHPFDPNPKTDNPWVRQPFQALTVNTTAQPNGHRLGTNNKIVVDNLALPPVWNPAGGAYLSMPDWLNFLRLHIDGVVGLMRLSPEALEQLHSIYTHPDRRVGPYDGKPEDQQDPDYGWGWGQWMDGTSRVLGHDGTYGRFYATTRVYLDAGFAVVAAANLGPDDDATGDDAVFAARDWLVGQAKVHCQPRPVEDPFSPPVP
jgi:D-alanyl-D-alanine carboxypeptidase